MAAYSMRIGEYLQRITNGSAQTAWAAATSQTGQLAELSALWSGDVEIRGYSLAGTLLTTLTYSGWNTDTSEATYFLSLDTLTDESLAVNDVVRYCKAFIPGGVEVVAWDISPVVSSDLSKIAVNGLRIYATASLPLADTPAWRTAMTDTNTVYAIGETPSSVLPGRISWPGGVDPGVTNGVLEYGGSDANALYMASGYGGSVYVPELGAYGTMLLGGTGEHSITEQINSIGISEDNPSWNFFQQPLYATSSAEADTYNADAYLNATDYATQVTAGRHITYAGPDVVTWDGSTFPVAFGNAWVLRRKYGGGSGSTLLGNNRPHWFRYSMPCYIPPAMTGTANGAVLVNSFGTIYGPFNSGPTIGPGAGGYADGNWYAEVHGSGLRKDWLHTMDVQTKAWTRLSAELPAGITSGGPAHPHSAVDEANKRVYYTCVNGSAWALVYADFSSGAASMAWTGPTNLTDNASGPTFAYTSIYVAPTTGPLAGERLWFFQDLNNPALLLIDLDANTLRRLTITGLPTSGYYRFGFDAATNRVYITTVGASIACCYFVLPSDPTDAANYTITTLTIDMNGSSVESSANLSDYGQRSMFLPTLGAILVPMKNNKTLAFRPA